jgi:hypothetical protein
MRDQKKNYPLAAAISVLLAGLGASSAQATPLPPATFTYNVVTGLSGACAAGAQATDGSCTSGSNFATTNGGTLNNTGTSVSTGASGAGVSTYASMTYYFEVGGPPAPAVPGGQAGQIAVDILSSGSAFLTGGSGLSFVSLLVTDSGSDAGIPAGAPDPDQNLVVDSRYFGVGCSYFGCTTVGAPWSESTTVGAGFTAPDHLCLTQGDMYAITITAATTGGSPGVTGGASLDPKIIVDPQGPTDPKAQCYQPTNPLSYQAAVTISDGASTGVPLAESGTLGLMGLGLFGVGLAARARSRARQRA